MIIKTNEKHIRFEYEIYFLWVLCMLKNFLKKDLFLKIFTNY